VQVRRTLLLLSALSISCAARHRAPVAAPDLPPMPASVRHSGKLWVELRGVTDDEQCVRPDGQLRLCFDGVHAALGRSLVSTAWTSFPAVKIRQRGDDLEPGDYLLLVSLELDPLPPDARSTGWAAAAHANWHLARDGMPLTSGVVASRSRAGFAYGRPLGIAAGEVIAAVGAHIADRLSKLPESKPSPDVPLPPVIAALER
jgi:hypothetical protein